MSVDRSESGHSSPNSCASMSAVEFVLAAAVAEATKAKSTCVSKKYLIELHLFQNEGLKQRQGQTVKREDIACKVYNI